MRKSGIHPVLPMVAVMAGLLTVSMGQEHVSIDFPPKGEVETTSWHYLRAADTRGIAIDLLPPTAFEHLMVTVVFEERRAEELSAVWLPEEGPDRVIVENFIEGIDQANQGVFVLHQALLGNGGTLVFQGDSAALDGVRKIRMAWVDTLMVYGARTGDVPSLVQEGGKTLLASELAGVALGESGDHYREGVVRATLTDQLTSLVKGVAFMAPLAASVERVRFEAKITGLPLDGELAISVNGYPAQVLPVEAPSLRDPGYIEDNGRLIFAGWRKAAIVLPAKALRVGDNYVVIEPDPNAPEAMLKDAVLEVVFGETEVQRYPESEYEPLSDPAEPFESPKFRISVP